VKVPLPLTSGYEDSRRSVDEQKVLNMYHHSSGGMRQFPGQVEFYSDTQTTMTFTQNADVVSNDVYRDIKFHASGTKIFAVDLGANTVVEATLSSAWDISTAGSWTATALTHTTPDPSGLCFNADGTKMFIFDTDDSVYRYTLSPAWDTTSLSYDSNTFSMNAQLGSGFSYTGVFNSDGSKLYVAAINGSSSVSTSEQRVFQYNLSSNYDLSTASYSGYSLYLGGVREITPLCLAISADDQRIFVGGRSAELYKEYYLADTSDVSTAQEFATFNTRDYNPFMFSYDGSTDYAYTGHQSDQYFTDDNFTIVGWFSPDDSTPSATQWFLTKWQGASTKDFAFGMDTSGDLYFQTSSDGTSATAASTSTATPSWSSADGLWVRVTWSGSNVDFYTSTDPLKTALASISWSQLGATVAHGESTMLRTNSSRLEVGAILAGTSGLFDGEVGRVALIGGTDATASPEYDFNPVDHDGPISTNWITFNFTSSTGETWTNLGFVFWPDYGMAFGDSGGKFYIFNQTADGDMTIDQFATSSAYSFTGGAAFRGMLPMNDVLYAVYGTTLYSINSGGTATSIGTIDGTAKVVMDTDGTQLVITTGTTGSKIYVYTVAGGLVTVTDADVTDTANSNAYLDLRFWFDQPNGQFNSSAIDDATDFDALDFATAESFADDLTRVFAHNQMLYLFGERSIEVWRTSTGRPPASRQAVIERGIAGVYAVDSTDDMIFFVDQDGRPNMLSGRQYQPIFTPAIAEEWSEYTNKSSVIVSAYKYHQMTFVDFIFPTVSWTYHVDSGKWSERDSNGSVYKALGHAEVYGYLLAGYNAKIYRLNESTYQDDGNNIVRQVNTGLVKPELIGTDARELTVDGLWLTVTSTTTGAVTVGFARDGGSVEALKTINVSAGTKTYPLPTPWGKCREGYFQIRTTADAGIDIDDVMVEVNPLYA